MNIEGTITKILPVQTGHKKDGSGEWKKQTFILDSGTEYNNIFAFEVFGEDKVNALNQYNKIGDTVSVEFNVNTNEYQGKFFTTLQSWKIEKVTV